MTLKDQWKTIKENWLIALLVIVLLVFSVFGGGLGSSVGGIATYKSAGGYGLTMAESAVAPSYDRGIAPIYYDEGFAPEVQDRKITKTASLSTEVERGTFSSAQSRLKAIITSSDSYLLNENVNKYDQGRKSYYSGSYQIKIDSSKYDSVVSQIKEIGEIQSFSESADDITGRYTDLSSELQAEKARLQRYREMYNEAESVEDKINLNDRIFNQERTVKYLEDAIKSIDQQVSYSTLYVTISEKRSEYADTTLVKLSQLIRNLVGSFNSLLSLVFSLIPYAIAAILVWVVYRAIKKRK